MLRLKLPSLSGSSWNELGCTQAERAWALTLGTDPGTWARRGPTCPSSGLPVLWCSGSDRNCRHGKLWASGSAPRAGCPSWSGDRLRAWPHGGNGPGGPRWPGSAARLGERRQGSYCPAAAKDTSRAAHRAAPEHCTRTLHQNTAPEHCTRTLHQNTAPEHCTDPICLPAG
jgi:hypothetical protein